MDAAKLMFIRKKDYETVEIEGDETENTEEFSFDIKDLKE